MINALNVIKTANVEKEKHWAVMLERKKSLILCQLSCDLLKLFIQIEKNNLEIRVKIKILKNKSKM